MKREILSLRTHYLVCGFGRMGYEVSKELARQHLPFVVVDELEESIERAQEFGFMALRADPGLDETLVECGIEHAKGLAAVSDDDRKNLMVVVTARLLNPTLTIVARASAEDVPEKFFRVGADSVYLPYRTGGRRIAQTLLRPAVVNFCDEVLAGRASRSNTIEALRLEKGSILEGATIGASGIRENTGVQVVAIKRQTGELEADLGPLTQFRAGDTVIVLGGLDGLTKLADLMLNRESLKG